MSGRCLLLPIKIRKKPRQERSDVFPRTRFEKLFPKILVCMNIRINQPYWIIVYHANCSTKIVLRWNLSSTKHLSNKALIRAFENTLSRIISPLVILQPILFHIRKMNVFRLDLVCCCKEILHLLHYVFNLIFNLSRIWYSCYEWNGLNFCYCIRKALEHILERKPKYFVEDFL